MKFPKVLYVRRDLYNDETDIAAYDNLDAAVEDDGPTEVAIYNLSDQTKTYEKVVQVAPVSKK